MPIDLKMIDDRGESKNLHITLSKVISVARSFVSDAQDETDAIDRANKIEHRLRILFGQEVGQEQEANDCPPGTVYNPVTGNCE